jgi:digeranylgeranylglycerophospholipid reductase
VAGRVRADCVVVGASFAGLAAAHALARSGVAVTVLEKKADAGAKLHTTGIIVKDAVDQIALLETLPAPLVRRIERVRLYAPSLRSVDLAAPGYYFLATDTPALMRWLAAQVEHAGARIAYGTAFAQLARTSDGFELGGVGATRYLIGADGPRSRVARTLGLGASRRFLFGVEYEYAGLEIAEPDHLHCFIDRRLAPGYIGWVLAGVSGVQAGLARRTGGDARRPAAWSKRLGARSEPKASVVMQAFLEKIAPAIDLRARRPSSIRAGLIPCGGVVKPVATARALLVGDAAGLVSPVTAGGIHTALKHGREAGVAVAEFLGGRREDPAAWLPATYPSFRAKRALRFLFDHFQSDLAFNLLLATRPVRAAASLVYFHRRGLLEGEPR